MRIIGKYTKDYGETFGEMRLYLVSGEIIDGIWLDVDNEGIHFAFLDVILEIPRDETLRIESIPENKPKTGEDHYLVDDSSEFLSSKSK